jgi:hypothetical protein
MENHSNYTKEDIAFGLSSVILNEDNEQFELGLEEINEVNEVCLKIVDALDNKDLKLLAKIRPNTFIEAIESKRKIDEIMKDVQ